MTPPERCARGIDWRLLWLLWTIPGFLQFLQEVSYGEVFHVEGRNLGRLFVLFVPGWYPWIALTPFVVFVTRWARTDGMRLWARASAHVAACLIAGATHLLLFGIVRVYVPAGPYEMPPLSQWLQNALWSFAVQGEVLAYLVVVAVTIASDAQRRSSERELRTARLEGQLASARVAALQGQLRPHFLFNTLNGIGVMMREDVDAAELMLLRLSQLLRSSLDAEGRQCVSLREELEHLELYLGIERARFSDRLGVEIDVPDDCLGASVPTLALQPLVENSIVHGIAPRASGGRVRVRARREGASLRIEVEDDGVGLNGNGRRGVGLENTRRRLEELYRDEQSFALEGAPGGGARVVIQLPFAGAGAGAGGHADASARAGADVSTSVSVAADATVDVRNESGGGVGTDPGADATTDSSRPDRKDLRA